MHFSDELGMGFMRHSSGSNANTAAEEETEPERFPVNPCSVSGELATKVLNTLSREVMRLNNLAGPKQAQSSD